MFQVTVDSVKARETHARLRATYPDAYIVSQPSALYGEHIISVYPEG